MGERAFALRSMLGQDPATSLRWLAADGMDVWIFFTFYGLNIIHRAAAATQDRPVGNPAMTMPVPVPDIISSLPGMVPMASAMMRSKFANKNVATIGELLGPGSRGTAHRLPDERRRRPSPDGWPTGRRPGVPL